MSKILLLALLLVTSCYRTRKKHQLIFSVPLFFSFSNMDMCMDRCCAQRGCNLAYMVDRNCFSVACFSPSLCKISDVSTTNGDVEISTIMASNAAETPAEKREFSRKALTFFLRILFIRTLRLTKDKILDGSC